MTKPERLYIYNGRVFLTYWMEYTTYANEHFGGEQWHCWEEKSVFFGFRVKGSPWFGVEDMYYDGHTMYIVNFAGLSFGKLFSYDARKLEEA